MMMMGSMSHLQAPPHLDYTPLAYRVKEILMSNTKTKEMLLPFFEGTGWKVEGLEQILTGLKKNITMLRFLPSNTERGFYTKEEMIAEEWPEDEIQEILLLQEIDS